jgi:nucleoside-diphosphate-sugar epimerase
MRAGKKIAVAGATGRVGHHVVDVLNAEGHDVVAMNGALLPGPSAALAGPTFEQWLNSA